MNSGKRNERLMLTAIFLFWFSVYTYPSFLTTYVTNTLGAAKVMAGMIVGSYGLTQMLLRIPLGILSDVMKKRKLFVVIGFVLSIGSSAGLTAAAMLAGQENVPDTKRGAAMGIYQALYGIGMFLGPVIGGMVIEKFSGPAADPVPVQGYIANFYAAMGIALAGGVLAVVMKSENKR